MQLEALHKRVEAILETLDLAEKVQARIREKLLTNLSGSENTIDILQAIVEELGAQA